MIDNFTEFFRGPSGGYELTRGLGALGGVVYVATSTAIAIRTEATLTEYCLQMPVGLAAILAAIAGGAIWKDRGSAEAKIIEQTGAIPAKPPAGKQVQPRDIEGEVR